MSNARILARGKSRPSRWAAAFLLVAAPPALAASDWQQIGLPDRPEWVDAKAERRLRLLAALPGIESTVKTRADAYIGSKGPGVSVGLVLDDGLYYSRGFGYRDANKSKVPDEQTVFCIGSFTKVFTGTALLVLRDAGQVALGDLASQYVPEISEVRDAPCPGGGCEGRVRLRHLLSHASGLPNEMSPAVVGQTEWLEELKDTRLAFWPGSFSAYSGVGTEMTGLIVERVSGRPYRKAMRELLLEPLGMKQSTFDVQSVPAGRKAQNWRLGWNAAFTAPRFTADSTWTDRKMLTAAGYLLSSVRDLSRFQRMWLSNKAPSDILEEATLADARQSLQATPSGTPIPSSCDSFSDGAGSSYASCGAAEAFGANWYIGASPYLKHNGSTGLCGSDTVLSPNDKMGATGLVSTDPFPTVPAGQTQPATVDSGFMSTMVMGLLTDGVAVDATSSWQGRPLAVGVARYLWALGVKMPAGMLPRRRKVPVGRPGAPLHSWEKPHRETEEETAFRDAFLAHFAGAYRKAHQLKTTESVAVHVAGMRAEIGACSTFRVRKAPSAHKVTLRLRCEKGSAGDQTSYDATLTVESAPPYRIAAIENERPSADPY